MALWAILSVAMSSVSRWLSGPSCFLQCHLSLGGSPGHLVAISSVSRWLSGPSCLLQCHLSPGGSLGHLACYTLICTSVALCAIVSTASSLPATHSCVPRWLSGPSCLLKRSFVSRWNREDTCTDSLLPAYDGLPCLNDIINN